MQFYLAAAHKSSGKTTIAIGLSAALTQLGLLVQTFKKGPDYIDSNWLATATKQLCFNLDFYTMSSQEIVTQFTQLNADIKLVEGNKGLFDGLSLDGSDSNAALANLLQIPVVLIIDCMGITRGIAPILLAYQNFNFPKVKIAGVIFNKVGGTRHQAKLIAATETYTNYKIFGAVPNDNGIKITERHLGLIPSNEQQQADRLIVNMRNIITDNVDLDFFKPATNTSNKTLAMDLKHHYKVYDLAIAVAKDAAFGFYYANDLLALKQLVKKVVFFSPLTATKLPDNIDGLFLGGGFPEIYARQIAANHSLLTDLSEKITAGLPTYAECAGLMILANSLKFNSQQHKMAGIINADCIVTGKPQGRGYVKVVPNANHPWQLPNKTIKAHEFHYSQLINFNQTIDNFVYKVTRGVGIINQQDGFCLYNLLANYLHLKHNKNFPWLDYFIKFCQSKK